MSSSENKIKFIPMLSQVEEASSQLPDPTKTDETSFTANISGTNHKITFEKIQVYRSDKTKTYKWTYKGRLFINSKFLSKTE